MKTSNKLLIAFAAALIIVPILSMVYVSKAFYTGAKDWSELAKQNDSFAAVSENMDPISLNKFSAINIANGKEVHFYIRLIKDNKFGVKINKGDKNFIKFDVDPQGQLQIELLDKKGRNDYISLFIYTPTVKALNVTNAGGIEINAQTDSLSVILKKVKDVSFNSASAITRLSITAEEGNNINMEKEIAKFLTLKLTNTNFLSEWASYQDLNIETAGKTAITIKGDHRGEKEYSIQNLTLHTTDKAVVNFEDIKIQRATGTLSDQTMVQMPAVNLKQMLK